MDDTIPENTPLKQCSVCGDSYPATRQYFLAYKKSDDGLLSRCKNCRKPRIQVPYGCKQCSKCKGVFAATAEFFHKGSSQADGLHPHCKQCVKIKTKQAYQVAKEQAKSRPDELVCKKCNVSKPATEEFFFRNPGLEHGLQSICKECRYQQRKQFEWENPERVIQRRKKAYQRAKIKGTLYHMTHPSRTAATRRRYQQEHKVHINALKRQYAKTEKGKLIATTRRHNRRAREKAATGQFTGLDVQRQFKAQKGKCYWCMRRLGKDRKDWHIDHVVPISRGGSNNPENLVIACPTCNMRRQDRLPHEWPEGGRLM